MNQPKESFDDAVFSPWQSESAEPRFASRGRAYVYIFPCRYEDILKVGFSRDPLTRLRTLHARFFDFFDLERGVLVELDKVRAARSVERSLINGLIEHRAPAPLVVPHSAAGHTEWFRGAYVTAIDIAAERCREDAFTWHVSLYDWLHCRLSERADLLYEWSSRWFERLLWLGEDPSSAPVCEQLAMSLRHTLDMCRALRLPLAQLVPPEVMSWYAPLEG